MIQHEDDFKEGGKNHHHSAEPGIHLTVEITSNVTSISYANSSYIFISPKYAATKLFFASKLKQSASLNIFTQSAPWIVEEVIAETGDVEAPAASRPEPSNLIRVVNRARLNMRPKEF